MRKLALLSAAVALALPAAVLAQAAGHPGGEVMFVSGGAQRLAQDGSRNPVTKGLQVQEGDRIRTDADSHVYVRLRDGGLLVVRPGSELVVERWRYDPARPEESQIKYLLENGVARHVSGKGAKAARDKFRFNTPLAAIGVRGTDFTVLAEPAATRVAVRSGGVIVSGLGNGCRADGLGPCEGDSAMELFANGGGRLLQVRSGERRPELIEREKRDAPAPDTLRPPAAAEPVAQVRRVESDAPAESRTSETVSLAQQQVKLNAAVSPPPPSVVAVVEPAPPPAPPVVVAAPVAPPPPPAVAVTPPVVQAPVAEAPVIPPPPQPFTAAAWGRFKPLAENDSAVVDYAELTKGRAVLGQTSHYALAVANFSLKPIPMPGSGSASFRLLAHDGLLEDTVAKTIVPTTAGEGKLRIDFGTRRFETTLPVQSASGIAATIQATGDVGDNGRLSQIDYLRQGNTTITSNSKIDGVLGKDAAEAAYIYQHAPGGTPLNFQGITTWRK